MAPSHSGETWCLLGDKKIGDYWENGPFIDGLPVFTYQKW